MQFIERFNSLIFPGGEPVYQFFPSGGKITFFCLKVEAVGGDPRVWKKAKFEPRPTYQIGRVMFLDEERYCLHHQYIEQESMNFGFWAIASGNGGEKIQHYDDSIERRGTGNWLCFVGPNIPDGLQIPIPGLPTVDTQYQKEPLTPIDDLVPDDFDQALCRVRPKKITRINYTANTDWTNCRLETNPQDGIERIKCDYNPGSTEDLGFYMEESGDPFTPTRYAGHEDNGFTRYFDPRRHGNGNWCCGYSVELFEDAGDVSLSVYADLYTGM